jgi:hypothetical protein
MSQLSETARPSLRPGSADLHGATHVRAGMMPPPTSSGPREAPAVTGKGQSRPGSAAGSVWQSCDPGRWGGDRPGTANQGERSLPALLQASHLDPDPAPSYWLSDHPDSSRLTKPARGRGRSFVDTLAAAVRNGFSSSKTQKAPPEAWTRSGPAHVPSSSLGAFSTAREMPRGRSHLPIFYEWRRHHLHLLTRWVVDNIYCASDTEIGRCTKNGQKNSLQRVIVSLVKTNCSFPHFNLKILRLRS